MTFTKDFRIIEVAFKEGQSPFLIRCNGGGELKNPEFHLNKETLDHFGFTLNQEVPGKVLRCTFETTRDRKLPNLLHIEKMEQTKCVRLNYDAYGNDGIFIRDTYVIHMSNLEHAGTMSPYPSPYYTCSCSVPVEVWDGLMKEFENTPPGWGKQPVHISLKLSIEPQKKVDLMV